MSMGLKSGDFKQSMTLRRDPAVLFPTFRMYRKFSSICEKTFRDTSWNSDAFPQEWTRIAACRMTKSGAPAAGGDNLFPSRLTRCSSSPFVRWIIYGDGCLHCFAYTQTRAHTYTPWAPDAARAPSGVYAISRYVSAYITTYPACAKGTLASLDADDIKSTDSQQADALRRKFRTKFSS